MPFVYYRLVRESKRMRETRKSNKLKIEQASAKNTEVGEILKLMNREVKGRPRCEVDQPDLLSAIVKIAQNNSAADDRRRCEALRCVTTLDDLVAELQKLGFNLSRSAAYLRLLPRRTKHDGRKETWCVGSG